jgi:hypothetical protein
MKTYELHELVSVANDTYKYSDVKTDVQNFIENTCSKPPHSHSHIILSFTSINHNKLQSQLL